MRTFFIVISFLLICISAPLVSYAQEGDPNEAKLCQDLLDTLKQGVSEQDAVSSYIMVGHSPCFVIKCAVQGKGDISEIIEGALNAGVTTDVISRCALLGGADSETVARTLENLVPPEGPTPPPYTESPVDPPHVPVSPSGF